MEETHLMFVRLSNRTVSSRRRFARWPVAAVALSVALLAISAAAAQPSRFVPSKYEAAQLRFVDGLPVATVNGTPAQMGDQLGHLLKAPLGEMLSKRDEIAQAFGLRHSPDVIVKFSRLMSPLFPESQRSEIAAMAKGAGADLDVLTTANILYDLSRIPACSTLAVEPSRSATGGALFGRNFDFPTFGFLDQYSLLVVYRPEGKHAFASVTFPAVVGVFSGMNDAGLCLAQLEVDAAGDRSPRIDLTKTPVSMSFREILESCTTIEETERLLKQQTHDMMCNLAVCDKQTSAVFEITPTRVARRNSDQGVCPCTNHFRTDGLAANTRCERYAKLSAAESMPRVGVADVTKLLNAANQGKYTLQTMVFEPATLTVHLSFGPAPSSAQPLKTIELAPLFGVGESVSTNVIKH